MKITLLIGSLSGGGAERVVCNLANYLVENGHDVTILTVSDKQTYEINKNVKHIVLYQESYSSLPHIIINLIRLYRMNRYFRKSEMDIYVTFLPKLSRFILAQKKFIHCPIILAERADPDTFCSASERNRKMFNKYYPLADGYVFQTEDAKKFYQSAGIEVRNSVVIANAINPDFIKPIYQGERKKEVVAVGRMTEQKNFSLLLRAFAKVSNDFNDYTLVIYGDGPLKNKLIGEAKALGIIKQVKFPGYVKNLEDYIWKSSLFVLSSNFEGMPNALMEAMALGIPVISTDCPAGGSRYLIDDNVNGRLIPVGDEDAMASAIAEMLGNQEYRKRLSSEAIKIQDKLNADMIYGKWQQFLEYNIGEKIDEY